MPMHDWTRVSAGTCHDFHNSWLIHLKEALNEGALPDDYYAMTDQRVDIAEPDVVTYHAAANASHGTGTAVLEMTPRVKYQTQPLLKLAKPRRRERRITIRHISGHQIVAIIEIVSPSNKDRRGHVRRFAEKVVGFLESGVHVLMIDPFPPTANDPAGMHAAIWRQFDRKRYTAPEGQPLTMASYCWDGYDPTAYIEPYAVGDALTAMPSFLNRERYIDTPLELSYGQAYAGMPAFWRNVIEIPPV